MTAQEVHENENERTMSRTPLPKYQLCIVFLIQIVEPLTATVVFPFAPECVRRTGITGGDETKTGYYAGLIDSAFFITDSLSVYHWGRASDTYGRRTILMLGPLGLVISMLGFGLSSNFWSLVLFRCLQGVFNGNIGVAKTVMGELTDSTNIGDVFAVIPLIWCVGASAGPIIGGLLANPAERWSIFERLSLFKHHPYLLPCGVAAFFALCVFILTVVSLQETHPAMKTGKPCKGNSASASLLAGASNASYGTTENISGTPLPRSSLSSLREVANKDVLRIVLAFVVFNFNVGSYDVLIPLMFSTSVGRGGLGLTPYHIGWIMFVWGATNAVLQLFLTSHLIRRFGPRRTFIVSALSLACSFLAFSFESFLAMRAGRIDWRVAMLIGVHMTLNFLISAAYGAVNVLIVQAVTSREMLGSTNGLTQMVNSGIRGMAPSAASSLFSFTLQRNMASGFGVYIFFVVVMFVGFRLSFGIPRHFDL